MDRESDFLNRGIEYKQSIKNSDGVSFDEECDEKRMDLNGQKAYWMEQFQEETPVLDYL